MSTLDTLNKAHEARNEAEKKYSEAKQEVIERCHPLKIGDVVEIKLYAHIGKRMVITQRSVTPRYWAGTWEWLAKGAVLKKDGTPGQQVGEWRQKVEA